MHRHEQIFQAADEGKKGFLDSYDMKVALMMMFGQKISQREALQLLTQYGSKQLCGNLGVSRCQFQKAITEQFTVDEDEKIRSAFMLFDKCCRGFLTLEDVRAVFHQVCPHFADHRIEVAFRELDRDRDGRISYADFDLMMKIDHLS
ncbi:hypothetical protein BsWGS_14556 [Bradybaena similaris]